MAKLLDHSFPDAPIEYDPNTWQRVLRDIEISLSKMEFPARIEGKDENEALTWFFEGGAGAGAAGAGYFLGNNGATGDTGSGLGDIFRSNTSNLTADTTIASSTNASCTGPLTVDSSITLTVEGTLVII